MCVCLYIYVFSKPSFAWCAHGGLGFEDSFACVSCTGLLFRAMFVGSAKPSPRHYKLDEACLGLSMCSWHKVPLLPKRPLLLLAPICIVCLLSLVKKYLANICEVRSLTRIFQKPPIKECSLKSYIYIYKFNLNMT